MNPLNIITVKGVCVKNKQILLKKDAGGSNEWALPGGKIELGETPLQTVVRELTEELGKKPVVLDERPLWAYSFEFLGDDGKEQINCIYYKVDFDDYNFIPQEEQLETKFFSFEEIQDLNMNPGHKNGLLQVIKRIS